MASGQATPPGGGFSPLSGLVAVLQNIVLGINALAVAIKATFPLTAYLTGTWTPLLAFGGVTTGITYSAHTGTYTLIGREVTCRFHMVLTANGVATGAATIGGLPFAANADLTNTGSAGLCPVYSNMANNTETPVLTVAPSATSVKLETFGAAANAAIDDTFFTATTVISGQFSYFI